MALRERLVADRPPAAAVAVVAEVGHLRRHADHRLHERQQRRGPAPLGHVGEEALLQVALARVRPHRRQRHAQRHERQHREHGERELDLRLRVGLQLRHVVVHVARHVERRKRLAPAVDQHLGQRDRRAERDRVEVLQAEARALRLPPPQQQPATDDQVDRQPRGEERPEAGVHPEGVDHGVVAEREHDQLGDDQEAVRRREHEREPAAPTHVRRPQQRDEQEQPVLGGRVDDEAELGVVGDAARQVVDDERQRQDRVGVQQAPQPLLRFREGRPWHGATLPHP